MSPVVVGTIGVALLLILLAIRLPVGFAMALIGLSGFVYLVSPEGGLSMAARACWDQFASYNFSVIPLFILMGQFAFFSGISGRLYKSAYNWLGHMRGGLAMAGPEPIACGLVTGILVGKTEIVSECFAFKWHLVVGEMSK